MSERIDIATAAGRGDPGILPGLRRALLVGVFALLIVATLFYGISAERLLAARSTRMAGPESPVTGVLDQLDAHLTALVKDDYRAAGRTAGAATAERLQPILEGFRAARVSWLRFSDADLGIDVLLSHQFERRLEEFEQLFGRVAGPLASRPEPQPETYARLQRMAAALGDLVDQTRRAYLTVSRAEHARDMREIHNATRIFVYLGTLALAGFLGIGGLYLWQTRRYDRHIQALSELSTLLSSKAGSPLFEGLVSFLGRELGHAYVFIGQLNPADPEQVDTLAVYAHGKLAGNISYRLPGTPCANVMQRQVCFHPSGVQQKFPQDRLLQEMGVDSYAGTPLLDSQDQPLGILVLLDARPINPATISSSLIQIIASRAQTELERLRVEALRSSTLDGLEARVDARTADLRRSNDQLEAEVNARRDMERELEQARNLAEHANRAKGKFLANASHEIRTHINGLLGMLSLLEDGQMEGEQLEYIEMAHASGDVLLALINDLLDYSKIEAGQLQIETVDFDLDHLLGELSDLFGVRARAAGLELETEVDARLPRQLHGDIVRIRQVLSNLLDNALKFTSEGRVVLRLSSVVAAAASPRVRFEVEDTGIGFDPDKRDLLFAPFAQADGSITRRYGGTGLGLAICAQLVRLLGGEIDVDGAPGLGTRFWFTIPLQPQQGSGTVVGEAARDSLEGLRVLVVDDSAVSRTYLRSLLAAWRVDCEVAASGSEALERLRDAAAREGKPFELVILDRLMPAMDGLELAGRIGRDPLLGRPRLVMVTRYGGSVAADEALRSGISGYLNKPVSQSQLFDTLVRVTGVQARVRRPRTELGPEQSRRILVVEDNLVNQKVAAGMLHKLGYQADAVADGQQALEAIERTRYDLVLMDCQMPVMDGYSATGEIRAREQGARRLPIVAMTAHALGGERERCLAAGMDDYLAKPVRIADLKQKVDYWCSVDHATVVAAVETPAPPAAPAGVSGESAIDRATLDELREVMGDDLDELIGAYLDDTARRLEELHQAIDGQPDVLVAVAHTLKGSSANVGARCFAERCATVHQRAASDATDPALRDLLGALGDEFERVRSALESYRATL